MRGDCFGKFAGSKLPAKFTECSAHIFETSFPHNGFLQVIFENGNIGLILIFGALGWLMFAFIGVFRIFADKQMKFFIVTIFAVFRIDFSCFIVNESIYSKYILNSFSIIIGIMMALISKSRRRDTSLSGDSGTTELSNQVTRIV